MAPWAAAFLFMMGLRTEGLKPIQLLQYGLAQDMEATQNVLVLLVMGGLNACFLNITNFQVTADTSAVMLNVLGNVKNCIGIGVSVLIFGNPLLLEQAMGVVVCLIGVYFYQKHGGAVKTPPPAPPQAVELPATASLEEGR